MTEPVAMGLRTSCDGVGSAVVLEAFSKTDQAAAGSACAGFAL